MIKEYDMNKQEIYEFLKSKNIEFESFDHPAVLDMEDFEKFDVPNREIIGRNLFVRDQKKKFYYLFTTALFVLTNFCLLMILNLLKKSLMNTLFISLNY